MTGVSETDIAALRTSGLFDEQWYLEQYPDVKALGMDPAEHYLWLGKELGRKPMAKSSGSTSSITRYPNELARAEQTALPVIVSQAGSTSSKRIRVLFVSGEPHTPGHHYRIERYASAARAIGADVRVLTVFELDGNRDTAVGADLVVIWRAEWSDNIASLIELARKQGTRIIFDVDDLMFDPSIAKLEIIDGIRSLRLQEAQVADFYNKILTTLEKADYGSAPTSFLAHRIRAFQKPAFVLPNGYAETTLQTSRHAVRARRLATADGLSRIGYAGGTRTHQRDFANAARGVARVLRERPNARLVLFQHQGEPIVYTNEFADLADVQNQIEWREMVALENLPQELARFDINLAPLEPFNVFCESKSELKYFEAALVEVPTIASPTEVFSEAIIDGVTGFLARDEDAWHSRIIQLLDDNSLRAAMGRNALHDVLWRYGPERRAELFAATIEQTCMSESRAAHAFELSIARENLRKRALPTIPPHDIVIEHDNLRPSAVTVIVPVFNYANYVGQALESVRSQTLPDLDLVVIDDRSADESLTVCRNWIEKAAARFNRVLFVRNRSNSGLALTRNVGFAHSETQFVIPLDADNLLLPAFAERCLAAIRESNAGFVFPHIAEFGNRHGILGRHSFSPAKLISGNYIDAMSLVRKSTWTAVGGYDPIPFGWEDYDFWCKCVEHGLWGESVPEVLAKYRVHKDSMLHKQTDLVQNKVRLIDQLEKRHPWIRHHRPASDIGQC